MDKMVWPTCAMGNPDDHFYRADHSLQPEVSGVPKRIEILYPGYRQYERRFLSESYR